MFDVIRRHLATAVACASLAVAASVDAAQPAPARDRSPAELYRAACAACHGSDGRGMPAEATGFDIPLPDFTSCTFATREPEADWFAISHDGGPARAFDRRMPAFGEVLAAHEIEAALDHIRTFCPNPAWPRGELNLPRPLVTERAFPEDEAVVTSTFDTAERGAISHQFLYEHRLGPRSQYEVVVPWTLRESATGGWNRGLGDVAFAVKHVLAHSLNTGTIVSLSGEVVLPTGKESLGLGKGVTIFEPFVTMGQILPGNSFVHVQAGAELPADRVKAGREAFWRGTFGRTFEQARFGRAWSPMVELLGARELESGATAQWDLVPQMQVTLSKRQHIMMNAGVRLPINEREGRRPQVITYFLWDWFDGGITEGWR